MSNATHTIKLRKNRSAWSAWVENPQGGGGNAMTTSRTNKTTALLYSLRLVTAGENFVVLADDVPIASGVKLGKCAHNDELRGCFFCLADEAEAVLKTAKR